MLHLDPDLPDAGEAFRLCTSAKVSPAKRAALASYEAPVVQAAAAYERACEQATLHRLDPLDFSPSDQAGVDDMIDMYERRMRRREYPGRPIYDLIKNQRTKCPLCGIGTVRQVDHHLPKSQYPYLAVAPANLVPVCADCNFLKKDQIPSSREKQTLHPYFDNVEGERWLRAEFLINTGTPASGNVAGAAADWQVWFFVDPPTLWDPQLRARVEHHFRAFHLAELYEAQVADELDTLGYALEKVFDGGGHDDVRAHLLDIAHQRTRPRQNNWMTALYEALAASAWYCSGGFRIVASG